MLPRPLPRSLTPIKDESIAGYLLRLAHRVDLAPRDLLVAVGLSDTYVASVSNLMFLEIDHHTAQRLAEATRLSPDEIMQMTYEGLRRVYPSVDPYAYPVPTGGLSTLLTVHQWIFLRSTRYCPQCLAGDGSAIQNAHGGGWNRLWRLPPVFACLTHRCLLSHQCPACGQPAMANTPIFRSQLIPGPHLYGLHPAACRSTGEDDQPCPGRFDTPQEPPSSDPLQSADLDSLLSLQQRYVNLLTAPEAEANTARSVGEHVTARTYFADLRVAASLIGCAHCCTDPQTVGPSRTGAQEQRLRAVIARHIGNELLLPEVRHSNRYSRSTSLGVRTPVPLDALACASLLALADDMLASPDPTEMAERIKALFGGSIPQDKTMSLGKWVVPGLPLSDALRAAINLAREKPPKDSRVARRRLALQSLVPDLIERPRFGADNVPSFLPSGLWTGYFRPVVGASQREQRRTAAAVLAAAVHGGSVIEAFGRLGLSEPDLYTKAAMIAIMSERDIAEYRDSIHNLVRELNRRSRHPDYTRRRRLLRDWKLDECAWRSLTVDLDRKTGPPIDLGEKKRLASGAFIWTHATQSDHLDDCAQDAEPRALATAVQCLCEVNAAHHSCAHAGCRGGARCCRHRQRGRDSASPSTDHELGQGVRNRGTQAFYVF